MCEIKLCCKNTVRLLTWFSYCSDQSSLFRNFKVILLSYLLLIHLWSADSPRICDALRVDILNANATEMVTQFILTFRKYLWNLTIMDFFSHIAFWSDLQPRSQDAENYFKVFQLQAPATCGGWENKKVLEYLTEGHPSWDCICCQSLPEIIIEWCLLPLLTIPLLPAFKWVICRNW